MRYIAFIGALAVAHGCSNILVTKTASTDGAPHIAYAADDETLFGNLRHFPDRNYSEGEMQKVWDWDSGTYLGEIPYPASQYNVVGNMNEHGLTIGETTFGGLESLSTQPGAKMDYGTLIWNTLGVAKTAREAIRKMAEITNTHGYYSTGETFSLADTEEVWLLDFIGKGPGEVGAVWVARKVPEGMVTAHANQARIRTWDWTDTTDTMWSSDVVSFAVKKGLYPSTAKESDFSFSDTYDPVTFSGARLGEARAYSYLSAVSNENGFAARYLDYAQGYNLTNRMPLFVTPKTKQSVNDTMWHMRTHFDGTWFDESNDVGAGAFHARMRARPLTWKYGGDSYLNERTIGVQQTGWNFVAHSRGSYMPKETAAVIWFAVDDTSTGPHFPAYANSRGVPETWVEGEGKSGTATTFVFRSAHWAYNMVASLAYAMWEPVFPFVQARIVQVEADFHRILNETDIKVAALLKEGRHEEAITTVTEHTVREGDALVDRWLAFYGETFARFHDYSDITYETPKGQNKAVPNIKETGFDDAWKARIVKEAGDKYRIPKSLTPEDYNKLKSIK